MIVLYVLGYFNRNKQNSYAALNVAYHCEGEWVQISKSYVAYVAMVCPPDHVRLNTSCIAALSVWQETPNSAHLALQTHVAY